MKTSWTAASLALVVILGTALFLAARMGQPLLLEGEPGVGKTEAAKALAGAIDSPRTYVRLLYTILCSFTQGDVL